MQFQILSHAGMAVRAGGKELLFDPWLVGSTYWRSWWNYPPVPRSLVNSLKPDFIYLTHIHWDHFQADSLRLFPEDIPIFVPYCRIDRMVRDLRAIGKTNIIELRHGESVELAPDFKLFSYHFGPFVTDSAAVVEAEGRTLFNANDAKFAGSALQQIINRHKPIDFCFRSHSSANPRLCYSVSDKPEAHADDTEHYVRAFTLFMERVKPAYAIPFASNQCHLHDDTFDYNAHVQTPERVRSFFEQHAATKGLETGIEVMIPGDSWDEQSGFSLQEHDYFTNRDAHLAAYRERVAATMEKQRALEARINVSLSMVQKFVSEVAKECPALLLRPLKGRPVAILATGGRSEKAFAIDLPRGEVEELTPEAARAHDMRIEIPALILFQAIKMNMFDHAGISKRVRFIATKEAMPLLKRFVSVLDWKEAEMFPVLSHARSRPISAVVNRWREGLVYARVVWEKVLRRQSLPEIEERLLAG